MSDHPVPNAALLNSLGQLVRGLSALFWGLPIAMVVCVQTAKGDWFRQFGVLPPLIATGLLFYGLSLLGHFQRQERIWRTALDRARILAFLNIGFSPFLYWWSQIQSNPFFLAIVTMMVFSGILFLLSLNPVLSRLTAMLPDETMRAETRLFTTVNRYLLLVTLGALAIYFTSRHFHNLPKVFLQLEFMVENSGLWLGLFLVLLPLAMTMALIWKIKEVIFASVFGPDQTV